MPARVSTLFSRFPEQLLQVQGEQEPEEKPRPKIQAPRDKYRAWDQEQEETRSKRLKNQETSTRRTRDKYKANKRQVAYKANKNKKKQEPRVRDKIQDL